MAPTNKKRPDVQEFGADSTGLSDSTSAFQKCFDYVAAIRQDGSGGIGRSSMNRVWVPRGRYKISAALLYKAYMWLEGDKATLFASGTGYPIIDEIYYQSRISGIIFEAGDIAVRFFNGYVDTTQVDIDHCEFHEQTEAAIQTRSSNSMVFNIEKNKFINITGTGRKVLDIQTGDQVKISKNWFTSANRIELGLCNVTARDNIFTPYTGLPCWFKNNSAISLTLHRNRFGGETGATTIVEQHAGLSLAEPTSLTIENNSISLASSYAVDFYKIPNRFSFKDNQGFTGGGLQGFNLRAGALDPVEQARGYLTDWTIEDNSIDMVSYYGPAEIICRALSSERKQVTQSTALLTTASKVLQKSAVNAGDGYGASIGVNCTSSTVANTFGAVVRRYVGNNAAYDATANEHWDTALNGLTNGAYTAVFDVKNNNDHPVAVLFTAGGSDHNVIVTKGIHSICVPFWYDSAGPTPSGSALGCKSIGWTMFFLNNAQSIEFSDYRIYEGFVTSAPQHNETYGTAAPASGTWNVGDRVWNTAPASAGFIGWVCTVAGSPGTWKTFGLIS